MTLYCPNGHENVDVAAFCIACGSPLAPRAASDDPAIPEAGQTERPAPPHRNAPDEATHVTHSLTGGPAPDLASADTRTTVASRRGLLIGAVIGVILLVAVVVGITLSLTDGESGRSGAASGNTIRGIAFLLDPDGGVSGDWDSCSGTGGYTDFSAGVRLSVKGADGQIVGSGDVVNVSDQNIEDVVQAEFDGDSPIGLDEQSDKSAAADELRDLLQSGADTGIMCMLYFSAEVDRSEYYSIELSHRGDLSYSREDLAKQGYVVGISLGGAE